MHMISFLRMDVYDFVSKFIILNVDIKSFYKWNFYSISNII